LSAPSTRSTRTRALMLQRRRRHNFASNDRLNFNRSFQTEVRHGRPFRSKDRRRWRKIPQAPHRRRRVFRRDLSRRFPAAAVEEWRSAEGDRVHDRPRERQNHRIRRSASPTGRTKPQPKKPRPVPPGRRKPSPCASRLRKRETLSSRRRRRPRPTTPSRPPLPSQWARMRSYRNGGCWPSSTRQGFRPNWRRSAERRGTARPRLATPSQASSARIISEEKD